MSMIPVRRHWEESPQLIPPGSAKRSYKRRCRRLTRQNARDMIESGLAETTVPATSQLRPRSRPVRSVPLVSLASLARRALQRRADACLAS